ncbi:hypothetical protein [Micromonospora sp. NBC_01796]|uniref:hypothetical protein n=1 Tax=Micromonospora sp. NBC_01796 TaxID=2975987 RepID=UPI002DD99243|nr:hypothetical protein [Micromonospora sp. NBC_01796]WSA87866.1 hypothetical protein OIE47_09815 [Micromonospora sp. NBC_01796]
MTGAAAENGETIGAVRATAYRLGALADASSVTVLGEADGWTRLDVVDGVDLGALSVAARTPACLLRVDDDTFGLRLSAYGPDGASVGPLDVTCTESDALSVVTLFGLPDGAAVLHRALTSPSTGYHPPARLADACRAVGLPLELLTPAGSAPVIVLGAPPAQPEVGVVLVYASAVNAAAAAPLTTQSAWTVPIDGKRSLHLWDGRGERANLALAAEVLADRRWATLAYWWSERTAGFVLTRANRVAGAHEWGGSAPVTPEGTARAARQLAEEFGVPEQALTVTALLRRTDLEPMAALTELGDLLGLPADVIGRTAVELADWAASVPGAVRTERLGFAAAVVHSVREHSSKPPREDLYHPRPLWRRLLSGFRLLVFVPILVLVVAGWLRGDVSGWWVLLGLALTADAAWGVRPGRRSRMHVNRGTTPTGGRPTGSG